MSKKQKLKKAEEELFKINLDEKTYNYWKNILPIYLDEDCENLMNGKIAYLLKVHGLKNESKP